MNNKFNFFIESDVQPEVYKAAATKESKYNNMIVFGRATSNAVDRQGEILEPSGFDFADFLTGGVIDLEHFYTRKEDPSSVIGEPLDAYVKDNEFYIKGKLYKGNKKAEALWDLLLNLKENNSTRKLGWSIEGSKIEADPINKKRITKAKIRRAALTLSPVGYNTYADIVKGQQAVDYIDAYTEEEVKGKTYILQFEKDGQIITVNRDYSIDIKPKSIDTEDVRGLSKESMKKKIMNLENWDTIMKAIKNGIIKREHLPQIIKNVNKNFIIR